MAKRTLSQALALFITTAALTFTSCRENTIINTNLTPTGDSLNTETETIDIVAQNIYTHFVTSTYVSGIAVIQGVGTISQDPDVGKINSGFYFQVVPPKSNGYGLPGTIDSIVLVLPYQGFTYGDTTANTPLQTFRVYRINQTLSKETEYYNNSEANLDNTELGQVAINVHNLKDSVTVDGKKVRPHLRIKLNKDALEGSLRSANYNSYGDFLTSFNGLHVQADSGSGNAIPYFRLSDIGSGDNYAKASILVYYKNADTTAADVFGFDPTNCVHFSRITNNITGGAAVSGYSYDPNATQSHSNLFFQSRPGWSADLVTKGLKNMPDRLINRAYIVITESAPYNDTGTYFHPEYLFPYRVDANDSLQSVADQIYTTNLGTSVSGIDFVDGKRRKVNINGQTHNQYIINVPRELQKALKNKEEMHLRITGVAGGFYGAYRLRAGGYLAPDNPFNISLKVVYSKLQ